MSFLVSKRGAIRVISTRAGFWINPNSGRLFQLIRKARCLIGSAVLQSNRTVLENVNQSASRTPRAFRVTNIGSRSRKPARLMNFSSLKK
jgi:hypothetical protein